MVITSANIAHIHPLVCSTALWYNTPNVQTPKVILAVKCVIRYITSLPLNPNPSTTQYTITPNGGVTLDLKNWCKKSFTILNFYVIASYYKPFEDFMFLCRQTNCVKVKMSTH